MKVLSTHFIQAIMLLLFVARSDTSDVSLPGLSHKLTDKCSINKVLNL